MEVSYRFYSLKKKKVIVLANTASSDCPDWSTLIFLHYICIIALKTMTSVSCQKRNIWCGV